MLKFTMRMAVLTVSGHSPERNTPPTAHFPERNTPPIATLPREDTMIYYIIIYISERKEYLNFRGNKISHMNYCSMKSKRRGKYTHKYKYLQ